MAQRRSRAAIPAAPAMGKAVIMGAAPVEPPVAEARAEEAADSPLASADEAADAALSAADEAPDAALSAAEEAAEAAEETAEPADSLQRC